MYLVNILMMIFWMVIFMSKNMGNRPPDYYTKCGISKKEIIKLVQLSDTQEIKYIVTSNIHQTEYYLYENVNGEWKKTKKQDTPMFSKVEKYMNDWKKKLESMSEEE